MKQRMFAWLPDWVWAGAFAGLLWGSWAFFANYEYGLNIGLKAFVVQGLMSFSLASVVTAIVSYFMGMSSLNTMKYFISVSVPFILVLIFQLVVHSLASTPNIIATIFPSVSAAGIWCLIYANKLSKFEKERTIDE